MKYENAVKAASLAALFSLSTAAHAIFIDLSGIAVDGGTPTVINVVEDESINPTLDIFWDFGVLHVGGSWGSETDININNSWITPSDVSIDGVTDCGFATSPGLYECSGSTTVSSSLEPGDSWTITLSDSFNDNGAGTDYTFTDGSYIAWGDDAPNAVPAPATLALLSLGLLLAGGFSRKKKSA